MNLKKTDNVIILSGKDKGKQGKILRVLPDTGKIIVEGINERKKHKKATRAGQKGQVVTILGAMQASNAAYFCTKCAKGVRIGSKMVGDKKVRVCKKCSVEL